MAAALVVGSWHLEAVPAGWEILPGYGVRRVEAGVFASVLVLAEERLTPGTPLAKYVTNQIQAAKVLFPNPIIKGPDAFAVPGATEALRLGVSYITRSGQTAVHFQIYATDGEQAGNATFTTIKEELPNIGTALGELFRGLRFHGRQPA